MNSFRPIPYRAAPTEADRPRVTVLYHYFHPDDVVSAKHFGDFCTDLAQRGWDVVARPCNRGCRDESQTYPAREVWEDVAIVRMWRPRWRQASGVGRILNAAWMLTAWALTILGERRRGPDILILGTDPVLSILLAPVIRKLRPNVRIVHWCFDLYPESPIAEGMLREGGLPVRLLQRLLRRAYSACDLVADLGSCMRERLAAYDHTCRKVTLVPWALAEPVEAEPPDPDARRALFGEAALGILYSGNFGRAHSYQAFLQLARRLRDVPIGFSFGVRGNRAEELRQAIGRDDRNIHLAGFASEADLVKRLGAADIHLVSLREEWTGLVVPSKFFGALAAGRPVLFAGSRDSALARWIREYQVGWVLDAESQESIAAELRGLARNPAALEALKRHCHRVYQQHFSRSLVMDAWDRELRALLEAPPTRARSPRGTRRTADVGSGEALS